MANHKFFRCRHCGNFVGLINNAGVPMKCCGENMEELIANTTDAAVEKHVPVITAVDNGIKVAVGSVSHPMDAEHFIEFIYVNTENGGQRKSLALGAAPEATFKFDNDKPIVVFGYCNLHGLWKVVL